ncbi:MAG: outer membrane beta-barrel protein [Chitinophagaceae bacterium]|nr:outer membrane beta-barrel protein [Chitinophagaceae bacterium]MCW5905757.1 outer membrane beta-barrel protein [Chitinophagaceae bacterium]
MSKEQFNEKFERLVRKAVEQASVPYSEEAWQNMEQLLNKKNKRKKIIAWWWLFPLLLLIAVPSYWWYKNDNTKNYHTADNRNNNIPTEKNKQPNNIEKANNKHPLQNNKEEEKKETTVAETEINNKKNNTNAINENNKKTIITTAKTTTVTTHNKTKTVATKNKTETNQQTKKSISVQSKKTTQPSSSEKTEDDNVTYHQTKKRENIVYIHLATLKADEEKIMPTHTKNFVDTLSKTATAKKKKATLPKLEINILTAADVTTANLKNIDKISGAVGIGFSFYFSKKLSISTGFAVSRKLYVADSNTYKNAIVPNNYYKITGIDANCLVFDIPLNIQYKLNKSNTKSWLAIAGFSTYIMNSEKYDYDYSYFSYPYKTSYSVSNKNSHLFSILNLSVAYRKNINKNFSWQLAPYAKIPLTGIGEGKVQLYSLGVALSVHFKPSNPQK